MVSIVTIYMIVSKASICTTASLTHLTDRYLMTMSACVCLKKTYQSTMGHFTQLTKIFFQVMIGKRTKQFLYYLYWKLLFFLSKSCLNSIQRQYPLNNHTNAPSSIGVSELEGSVNQEYILFRSFHVKIPLRVLFGANL